MDKGTQVAASRAQVILPRYFDCKTLQDLSYKLKTNASYRNFLELGQVSTQEVGSCHPEVPFVKNAFGWRQSNKSLLQCIRLEVLLLTPTCMTLWSKFMAGVLAPNHCRCGTKMNPKDVSLVLQHMSISNGRGLQEIAQGSRLHIQQLQGAALAQKHLLICCSQTAI